MHGAESQRTVALHCEKVVVVTPNEVVFSDQNYSRRCHFGLKNPFGAS